MDAGGEFSLFTYWDYKPKYAINLELLGASFLPLESLSEDKAIVMI